MTKNEKIEFQIQEKINKHIDNFESLVFDSGAGSGKTYSLISSLGYILRTQEDKLKFKNQNIMCITYTNVAKEEIEKRIGNSKILQVSTIHERMWELIRNYQPQLKELHIEKITEELDQLKVKLAGINKTKICDNLGELDKLITDENKDFFRIYYENKNFGKPELVKALLCYINVKQKGNFVNYVKYKKKKLQLKRTIEEATNTNKEVKYNTLTNQDKLYRFEISHDTLLEYSYKLIKKYNLLKRAIVQKYPFILIDEYQDTNINVIKALNELDIYTKKEKLNNFIGYFGDSAQNIYEGVGEDLFIIHKELKRVKKEFNRRSYQKIIDVGNSIRSGGINQKAIEDKGIGNFKISIIKTEEKKEEKIAHFISEIFNGSKEQIDCLVLTNKKISNNSGFSKIYNALEETEYYKNPNNDLSREFLKEKELGEIPRLLFELAKKIEVINSDKSKIMDLFSSNKEKVTLKEVRIYLKYIKNKLKLVEEKTLEEYLNIFLEIFNNDQFEKLNKMTFKNIQSEFRNIYKGEKTSHKYTIEVFLNKVLSTFYYLNKDEVEEISEKKIKIAREAIKQLLNLKIKEYLNWYRFITGNLKNQNINYHTYHGTKGEEYDNVLIILDKSFGGFKLQFDKFFEERAGGEIYKNSMQIRNLLYVACTRAKKDLTILCTEQFNKKGLKNTFGIKDIEDIKYI